MSIPYDDSTPAPQETPSVSQPKMLINAQSINSIWAVDHYTFQSATHGQHQYVRFPANVTPQNPTAPASVLYTQLGTAATTQSDLVYKNSNTALKFPVSMVRAFGTWSLSGNALTNSFNVTSASITSGNLGVVMPSGVVTGTNYCVIASTTRGTTGGGAKDQITIVYRIDSDTTFTLTTVDVSRNAVTDPTSISFIVIQA